MATWDPRADEIFVGALEIEDSAERRAFLDQQCGQDMSLREAVEALLESHRQAGSFLEQPASAVDRTIDSNIAIPEDYASTNSPEETAAGNSNAGQSVPDPVKQPERVGRYRVEGVLGEGGFGVVYLARDEQLDRPVAVKVPHARLISMPEDAQAYLAEARTVANLDHPHIVPVYDVGSTKAFPCYVVSKYVEGVDLSTSLKNKKRRYTEVAELVAIVAEALQHAHQQGLVHRDVKPGNILIGTDHKPYLVDFGLALREENIGKGPRFAGTPAYMSPEQARGEGHRVDGRSDIFSLGVVLYELLVGRQPFRGDTLSELLEQITKSEPRPPRQFDDSIPKELERICQKAIARRASARYSSARDLADDLRHFLADAQAMTTSPSHLHAALLGSRPASSTLSPTAAAPTAVDSGASSNPQPTKIIPKGLRSFDQHDADFFLELLPGPRDRHGLPDSLRFWKTRAEETDPDEAFSVGLIYGPSGSGKSSLVKAGLLPRLSEEVISVYVESTADETEVRLVNGLRKSCRALDDDLSLTETLAALRRGQGVSVGKKVLIVLDQFEQWLHGRRQEEDSDLVRALRQCDGGRVQCIVMVRDDFWLAATRFMGELEVELVQGQNTALADLFDLDHANKVLAAFGKAYGKLPETEGDYSKGQTEFLMQAVSGLAEDGKVVSVRLALFAEMMKGRPWTPAALKEVGGTEGVGARFLEETFGGHSSHPKHRLHQKAARAVLNELLPESGSHIRGQMKRFDELLEASGYSQRPNEFDNLIKILDSEIRLITPTDPEGMSVDQESGTEINNGEKYYQLTHDYLVPSLREWLTQKQRQTRRGRAELRLAEREPLWKANPENRHLPAWWEYLNIRLLTAPKSWSKSQRQMMAKAARVHALRWSMAMIALLAVGLLWYQYSFTQDRQRADLLVKSQLNAPIGPESAAILQPLRKHAVVILEQRFAEEETEPNDRARTVLVLNELGRADYRMLVDSIAAADPSACARIIDALRESPESAKDYLKYKAGEAAADAKAADDWRHPARLAIVALHLGDFELAQGMCRSLDPDPIQRTLFIDTFQRWHGDLRELNELVVEEAANAGANGIERPAWRSAICLAVGSVQKVDKKVKEVWEPLFGDWYTSQADALTHSSAGWALQRWKLELPQIPSTQEPAEGFDWHLNSAQITMVRIRSGLLEQPAQIIRIPRDFLLSTCEITVKQFREFMNDSKYPGAKPITRPEVYPFDEFSADHPVQYVSWYEAVMFCNWLSWNQGLPMCYTLSSGRAQRSGTEATFEVAPVEGAAGFRLPTSAEWEYACRAETTTRFSCGDDEETLGRYCVFNQNSKAQIAEVGSRMCNAWGLHDMHGNVFEWCYQGDVYRGGCWGSFALFCEPQIANESPSRATRSFNLGFRVVRVPSAGVSSTR